MTYILQYTLPYLIQLSLYKFLNQEAIQYYFTSMKSSNTGVYPRIIEVLQLKKPTEEDNPNILFKMITRRNARPTYLHFKLAAEKYPQTVITYLSRHITTKIIKQRSFGFERHTANVVPQMQIKPIFDCDYQLGIDQNDVRIPVVLRLKNENSVENVEIDKRGKPRRGCKPIEKQSLKNGKK